MNISNFHDINHCFSAKLAHVIGLEESIVFSQVHYWIRKSGKNISNSSFLWIYNSFDDWKKQFSYWSLSKIKRIFYSLEKKGILISKKINSHKWNHTKWYSLNYDKLSSFLDNSAIPETAKPLISKRNNRLSQNDTIIVKEIKNNYTNKTSISPKKENSESNKFFDEWKKEFKVETLFLTSRRQYRLTKVVTKYCNNSLEEWKKLISNIKSSDFLMGKVTSFKISFDWLIKESNLIKVLEGNYTNRITNSNSSNEKVSSGVVLEKPIVESNQKWKRVMEKAVKLFGKEVYVSWFSKVKFMAEERGKIILSYSSKFIKDWIETNYCSKLSRIWRDYFGKEIEIIFRHNEVSNLKGCFA